MFSEHHYKQDTSCTVIHEMFLFFLSLKPESGFNLYQENCTGVNLVEKG